MRIQFFSALALVLSSSISSAAVKVETVEYKLGKDVMEGFLAFDDAVTTPRPGVVVVHDWMGNSETFKQKAMELAGLGYVAFAADIYGKGVKPKDGKEAGALAAQFKKDRATMRARAQAALDVLLKDKRVDPKHIAAMGYCFGGTTALELARSGAALAAVVSFHGGLETPTPADAKNIKAKVLVLHGADDPYVPAKEVEGFEEEMRQANVDWQFVAYGGAVHAFTIKAAGTDNSKGAAYNEKADKRSWAAMKTFFEETLR